MKMTSVAVMVFSFRKYLITAMFIVLYQQLQGTLQLKILRTCVSSLHEDI